MYRWLQFRRICYNGRKVTSPFPKPSKYEVDKEALKPTISHSSEINLDPVSKVKPVEEILTDKNAVDDSFVIETAPRGSY
jgi:S-DNA-T family DNA segregation ATPase FtsK/SpoIIIE